MKKSLVAALVVILLGAVSVPVAFALTETQKDDLSELYRQMHELRLQIVEKQREAGLISAETAEELKEIMAENWQRRQELMEQGVFAFGPGLNCAGRRRVKARAHGSCLCIQGRTP